MEDTKQEVVTEVKKIDALKPVVAPVKPEVKQRRDLGNEIHVGDKELKVYINAALIQISSHNRDELVICGRGQNISKAVKIALILLERDLRDSFIKKDVILHSETVFSDKFKKNIKISGIKVIIARKV